MTRRARILWGAAGAGGAVAIALVAWLVVRDPAATNASGAPAAAARGAPGTTAPATDAGVDRAPAGPETIAGRVVGTDGRGLEGIDVLAIAERGAVGTARTRTGSDGAFVFAGVARAIYRVRAEGPGIVTAELRHVAAPARRLAMVVARRVRVAGIVRDGDGAAAGAEVEVASEGLRPRAVTADAAGRFAIEDLPEGTYTVAARRAARAALATGVERFGVGPWKELKIELGPAALLTGVVVDAASGAHVPGARVVLEAAGEGGVRRAEASADGDFEIAGLAAGTWTLDVDAPGYLPPARRVVEATPGGAIHLDVELRRGATVAGRVVTPSGAGVAGATIELAGTDAAGGRLVVSAAARTRRAAWAAGLAAASVGLASARLLPIGELGVLVGPVPYPPPPGATVPIDAEAADAADARADAAAAGFTADADGRFRIEAVPAGRWIVRASHPDHAGGEGGPIVVADGDPPPVTVVVRRGIVVAGLVTDEAGTPVLGAQLALRTGGRTIAATFSDVQGRYRFEHVTGDVVLRASAREHGEIERPLAIDDEEDGRELDVPVVLPRAGATIAGEVLDPLGRPAPGAVVTAAGASGGRGRATADRTGRFTLVGLAPGEHLLEAEHPDWAPARLPGVAAGAEGVRLALRGAGGIRGDVRDAHTLGPVLAFTVAATGPDGASRTRSFERGELELAALSPGRWRLVVSARGYATRTVQVDVPAGRDPRAVTVDRLRIELPQGATIAGRVYDAHGQVVSGATVACGGVRGTTDVHGAFRLTGVTPGDAVVRASHPRLGQGEAEVPLRSGDEVLTLELRLAL